MRWVVLVLIICLPSSWILRLQWNRKPRIRQRPRDVVIQPLHFIFQDVEDHRYCSSSATAHGDAAGWPTQLFRNGTHVTALRRRPLLRLRQLPNSGMALRLLLQFHSVLSNQVTYFLIINYWILFCLICFWQFDYCM